MFDPMAAMITDPQTAMAYGVQSQRNADDLSAHVSGGDSQAVNAAANTNAPAESVAVLKVSAAIVAFALIALWLLGGIVLRGV